MKFLILTLVIMFSIQSFANPSTSSSKKLKNPYKENKKKAFTLEFLLATEQTKEIVSKKADGTYTKFDTSLLQKITPNDELRYFLSTRYIDTNSNDEDFGNQFEFFFAEMMYRRKNILTEDQHGVYLEAELKNYRIIDSKIKKRYGFDGSIIPQVILKKKVAKGSYAKIKIRRHLFQTNNNDDYTLNFEDRVYLSYTKILKRKFMIVSQLKYQHKIRKGSGLDYRFMELAEFGQFGPDFSKIPEAKKHQEITTFHNGISYFLNRSSMIELYYETKLSNSYDNRNPAKIAADEFVLGSALYLTAF